VVFVPHGSCFLNMRGLGSDCFINSDRLRALRARIK
jgi:hypothetical protein